jgi:hypothetical protein
MVTGDEPANRPATHWYRDQIARITASDDAPARCLECIKVAALDFGNTADRLASGSFGAITQ